MSRKSTVRIGDFHGNLEVVNIIPVNTSGKHVNLQYLCHFCNSICVKPNTNSKRRNSCGCQQKVSSTWKSNTGAKSRPWQLSEGVAARNNLEFQYKRGAKSRNLDYTLTTEEFTDLVTGICVYCGDQYTNTRKGQGKSSGDFKYTGIDRIDSSKGYIKENCVPCCWTCNNMKSNTPKSQFTDQIEKIYNHIRSTK